MQSTVIHIPSFAAWHVVYASAASRQPAVSWLGRRPLARSLSRLLSPACPPDTAMLHSSRTTPPLKSTPSPGVSASMPPVHNGLSSLLRHTSSSSVPVASGFPPPHSAKSTADDPDMRSSSQPLPPFSTSSTLISALLHQSSSNYSFTNSSRSRASTVSSHDEHSTSALSALLSSPGLSFLQPHLQRLQALEVEQARLVAELAEATQKRMAIVHNMSLASSQASSTATAADSTQLHAPLTVDTGAASTSSGVHPLAGITSDLSPLRSNIHTHSARLRGASLERDRQRRQRHSNDDRVGQQTARHTSSSSSSSNNSPTSVASSSSSSPGTPVTSPSSASQSHSAVPSALLSASLLELLCHAHHPTVGLPLTSHSVRFKSYTASFTGTELVDWMLAQGWAEDRKDAVRMAQLVVQEGWMGL